MQNIYLNKTKVLIRQNLFFFVPYFLFLIAGLITIILTEKEDINLFLNRMHNSFWDDFFRNLTYLGNGLFVVAIVVPFLLLFRVKYALQTSLVYSISGLIAQVIKHLTDLPRPLLYLYQKGTLESLNLHIINGVDIYYFNSFPSGHTATAFSFCLILSLFIKSKFYGAIFFTIAFLIGISRVYLLQHFFVDVYVGSIIGVLVSLALYLIFSNWYKISNAQWYNFSLGNWLKSLFSKSSKQNKKKYVN